jgi:hypothetical protein
MVCGWRTSTRWFGLYGVDTATADERAEFLTRVRSGMTRPRHRATMTPRPRT